MKVATEIDSKYIAEIEDEYPEIIDHGVRIYTDSSNRKAEKSIRSALKKNEKRFRTILYYILTREPSRAHYLKCTGFTNIFEIILTKGKRSNLRIYCKEVKKNGRRLILIICLAKDFNAIKDNKNLHSRLKEEDKILEYKYINHEKKG